jgi:hypothetical protein
MHVTGIGWESVNLIQLTRNKDQAWTHEHDKGNFILSIPCTYPQQKYMITHHFVHELVCHHIFLLRIREVRIRKTRGTSCSSEAQ